MHRALRWSRAVTALVAIGVLAMGAAVLVRPAHAQTANAVSIIDFGFAPDPVTVNVGDTVTWTNTGQATHTATSDDGATFDSGFLNPGDSFSLTFTQAGVYTYHCNVHAFMTGTITVQDLGASISPALAVAAPVVAQASPTATSRPATPAARPAATPAASGMVKPIATLPPSTGVLTSAGANGRAPVPATMKMPATGTGGGAGNSAALLLALCGAAVLTGAGTVAWKTARHRVR